MKVDYYSISNIGNRELNEDSIGIFQNSDNELCFVLADGLGGHGHGEVASGLAISTAERLWKSGDYKDFLSEYYTQLEKSLAEIQRKNNLPNDYKTTTVIATFSEKALLHAHVGDSRLYFFRNGRVLYRTTDHSVPQMLVLSGDIREKDIRNHPDRSRLLKVCGTDPDNIFYDKHETTVCTAGDAILLCSDGFWELIDERHMRRCLKRSKTAKEWAEKMSEIVNKNGIGKGMDNNSAICIILDQEDIIHEDML